LAGKSCAKFVTHSGRVRLTTPAGAPSNGCNSPKKAAIKGVNPPPMASYNTPEIICFLFGELLCRHAVRQKTPDSEARQAKSVSPLKGDTPANPGSRRGIPVTRPAKVGLNLAKSRVWRPFCFDSPRHCVPPASASLFLPPQSGYNRGAVTRL